MRIKPTETANKIATNSSPYPGGAVRRRIMFQRLPRHCFPRIKERERLAPPIRSSRIGKPGKRRKAKRVVVARHAWVAKIPATRYRRARGQKKCETHVARFVTRLLTHAETCARDVLRLFFALSYISLSVSASVSVSHSLVSWDEFE